MSMSQESPSPISPPSSPPSINEVLLEVRRHQLNDDLAYRFHAYYSARNWFIQGRPIKDWPKLLLTWSRTEFGSRTATPPASAPPPISQETVSNPPLTAEELASQQRYNLRKQELDQESEQQYRRVLKERREAQSPEARQAMEDFFRKYQLKLNFSE